MAQATFVSYLRVSTERQGRSSFGLCVPVIEGAELVGFSRPRISLPGLKAITVLVGTETG